VRGGDEPVQYCFGLNEWKSLAAVRPPVRWPGSAGSGHHEVDRRALRLAMFYALIQAQDNSRKTRYRERVSCDSVSQEQGDRAAYQQDRRKRDEADGHIAAHPSCCRFITLLLGAWLRNKTTPTSIGAAAL
jgi:hypothetical protein